MKRLFITELDTALGRRVTERFGNAKEYEIVGTLRAPSAGTPASPTSPTSADSSTTKDVLLPPYVSRICPSYCVDATEFKRQVLESDIVICALTDSVLEAEAAIKMLAHTSFETEKNFVLVSSMMTWSNTFSAQRAEELAEKRRERQELIDAGEEVPEEEEDLPEPTEEDLPVFTDDQYQRRVPHARYQHWRDLEHLTKSANSETLHTNIIFGGITYGRGEVDGSVFHDLFRSAWHAQPLPLFTAGNNVVPLIHLDDLANLVYKVGGSNDIISQRYILGVDRGNHTLGAIVKAINDSLGCGKTYLVPPSQQAVIANSVQFTVDLRTEPGAALEVLEEGDWVSVDGFVANIEKIVEEYKSFRKVTPIRSVVVGPPLSGKSTLAASLAKTYRVEHLTISDIIRAYEDNVGSLQNELAQAREARREAKKQAAREAELAEEAEKRAAAEELAGETAAARGDDDGAEAAAAEAADADDEDAQAGQGGTKAVADDDDVSDIDFDEAPPLINDTPILGDGEDAGSGAIAPTTADVPDEEIPVAADDAIDPDEDEDERIAKFKEDIATARKVLQLRRQILYNFNPNATPANAAEADGAGDDAAAAEEGDGEGEGGAATSSGPPPVENPFLQHRFIDEALAVMVRWRLGQKDCRNQGYILDGFPKTVRQAALTFTAGDLTVPEPEELATLEIPSGEEGEEGALNPVDDKLLPERVIQLSIDPAHLRLLFSRAVEEPGKDVTQEMPSHDSAANFLRRLGLYQKNHTKALRPQKSVSVWWKSVGTAVEPPLVPRAVSLLEIDAARLQSEFDELRDEICAFLGLPHFYRPTPEEICEAAASEARRVEAVKQEALRQEEEARQEAKRLEDLAEQESLKHKRRYETVMREQQEAQLLKDMPAQDYLMTFVVPALTAGIEKTVQLRPEDPLDALAEYLFAYTARTRI